MTIRFPWFLLLAAACGPSTAAAPGPLSPATVGEAKARWPDAPEAHLEEGRQLFVAKCSQCHGYPAVASETEAEWAKIMDRMAKQAKLDEAQHAKVLHFIVASRAASTR